MNSSGNVIELKFTRTELDHLAACAEGIISGGHWGSSDIIIPEEQNLLAMLRGKKEKLVLSPFYLKMVIDWLCAATSEGTALLPVDSSIADKCQLAFEEWRQQVELDYQLRQSEMRSLQESFAAMGVAVGSEKRQDVRKKSKTGADEYAPRKTADYEKAVFGKKEPGRREETFSVGSGKKSLEKLTHKESRFQKIKMFLARVLDAGDRSCAPGNKGVKEESSDLKEHIEKAEKLQAHMDKRDKKF